MRQNPNSRYPPSTRDDPRRNETNAARRLQEEQDRKIAQRQQEEYDRQVAQAYALSEKVSFSLQKEVLLFFSMHFNFSASNQSDPDQWHIQVSHTIKVGDKVSPSFVDNLKSLKFF
jgi:hypothetical protein